MSSESITRSEVTIECVTGDITRQPDLEAVTNAANAQLRIGGGVAGAIHRGAGPQLDEECRPLAPISPGEAVITGAGDLPNRHVIHTLGPVYGHDRPEAQLLSACYRNSLMRAEEQGLTSIGFPAISTGAFGYPMADAAQVAMETIRDTVEELKSVRLIRFVLINDRDRQVHRRALTAAFTDPE
ncbi:MAG: macro domain-containing protein [Alkalispirochaeta sp.]